MSDFEPSTPDQEQVTLSFVDKGIEINNWTEYEYSSHVEVPSDGWSFSIGDDDLATSLKGLQPYQLPGQRVQLKVNGAIQGTGLVDSVDIHVSRQGGTIFNIQGRDRLAQAVDACADPTKTFKEGTNLLDMLVDLFAPFGWGTEDAFIASNEANRAAKASIRGTRTTKKKGLVFKKYRLHQLRPYPREGVYQFAARVAERHGLRIWQTADGKSLVVSAPDFDIDPFYTIRRNASGTTNVLSGSVRYDLKAQATTVVADGASSSGDFGHSRIKSIGANTAVHTKDPAYLDPWRRYPDANRVLGYAFATPIEVPMARTLYLHDEESTTQFQLDNFLRREMAKLQRQSLTVTYEVEGHGQIVGGSFVPWTTDATVEVVDDIAGLRERLYVLGRRFYRSRHGGTKTQLELIRLHTISLGEPPDPAPAPKAATDGEIVAEREHLFHEEQSAK